MAPPIASSLRTPTEVVRSYLSSFASGDPTTIAAHVTEDFVNEHTSALGRGCQGRDSYRERLPSFLSSMIDLRYQIEDLVEQDGQVMVTYLMTALWQGQQAISIRGAQRLVVNNGLISHRVDYWDSAIFMLQTNPAAAEALATFGLGLPAD